MRGLVLLAVVALAPEAAAQVYKCKGPGGATVYTSTPCSADAEPMKLRSNRASVLTEAEQANRDAVFRSTDLSSAGITESGCVAAATERIMRPANARIAGYQQQITRLNADAARARNNLAGATLYAGIQTQIAALQGSIASERSSADGQMSAARTQCADARRAREEEIRRQYDRSGAAGQ